MTRVLGVFGVLALLASASSLADQTQGSAAVVPAVDPALAAVVAGDWRSAESKARDVYRRPVDVLTFWGLKPGMTILEVQPGARGQHASVRSDERSVDRIGRLCAREESEAITFARFHAHAPVAAVEKRDAPERR